MEQLYPRILLVDDRKENLIALQALLDTLELEIDLALSGEEALGLLLKNDYSLVLMDVQMPDMDGFETAELMRGNKKTQSIPIIFVTAINKEDQYIFKGYDSGAVDYLFKPIDEKILLSKVKVFLSLARQRIELKHLTNQLEKQNIELQNNQEDLELLVNERTIQLQKARDEAEIANHARSKFLANITHELRTPLHAMLGFTDIVISQTKKEPPDINKIGSRCLKIKQSGVRLQDLIEELLTLADISKTNANYNMSWSAIDPIIKKAIHVHHIASTDKNISINFQDNNSPIYLQFDESRIFHVILNLIENAIKFTPQNGSIDIHISEKSGDGSHESEESQLELSFTDQGPGIAEEELTSIFEPFVIGAASDTGAGGKGLGLAICQEIIEAHHGKIWAKNNDDGNGSTFTISLPLQKQPSNVKIMDNNGRMSFIEAKINHSN